MIRIEMSSMGLMHKLFTRSVPAFHPSSLSLKCRTEVGDGVACRCEERQQAWLNSEVSDVHQDMKMGFQKIDELILGPPLGWAGFGPKYMLACATQAILLVLMCLHPRDPCQASQSYLTLPPFLECSCPQLDGQYARFYVTLPPLMMLLSLARRAICPVLRDTASRF